MKLVTAFYVDELEMIIDDLTHVQEIENDRDEDEFDETTDKRLRDRREIITHLSEKLEIARELNCTKAMSYKIEELKERNQKEIESASHNN